MSQKMIEEAWLPETIQLGSGNGCWLLSKPCECFAQALFQTAFPSPQSHVTSDADEDVKVVGHQHITPRCDVQCESAFRIFTERLMYRIAC
jgi:hypothetical protein